MPVQKSRYTNTAEKKKDGKAVCLLPDFANMKPDRFILWNSPLFTPVT